MSEHTNVERVNSLTWGVKQSFRAYVDAVGGATTVSGGATRDADGAFVFQASGDSTLMLGPDGALTGEGRFTGEVRFEAHGGMLSVFLGDLRVENSADGWVLSLTDSPKRDQRAVMAHLAPSADGFDALLAMDGYFILGNQYPPKSPIDPVRLSTQG